MLERSNVSVRVRRRIEGMGTFVYLDHAATTPVDPRVIEAMEPYFRADWGNPSRVYALGRRARCALD